MFLRISAETARETGAQAQVAAGNSDGAYYNAPLHHTAGRADAVHVHTHCSAPCSFIDRNYQSLMSLGTGIPSECLIVGTVYTISLYGGTLI